MYSRSNIFTQNKSKRLVNKKPVIVNAVDEVIDEVVGAIVDPEVNPEVNPEVCETVDAAIDATDRVARDELVFNAIRGDEAALRELMQTIVGSVLFRTKYLMRNHMDAEDVAQEILMRVCSKIHSLRDPKSFNTWLNSIVINESRRYMEKNYKDGNNSIDLSDCIHEIIEKNEDFIPQDYAEKKEHHSIILKIINKLPDRQREAILLHYYDYMSINEISKAMGIKQSGVSLYIKIAHEKIKRDIEAQSIYSPKTARGIYAIPVGALITSVLREEAAATVITNAAWIQQKATHCVSIFHYAKSAASNIRPVTKPNVLKQFLTPILSFSAAIATVAMIYTGLHAYWGNPPPPPEPLYIYEEQRAILPADGEIIFTGNEESSEHVNPKRATAVISNGVNALTAYNWCITRLNDNDIALFRGDGGIIDTTFTHMIESSMEGNYMLHITFKDEVGDILYKVSRQFTIEKT
jgi:RNA polymerase sigma-70 factor (ECF subfamily)